MGREEGKGLAVDRIGGIHFVVWLWSIDEYLRSKTFGIICNDERNIHVANVQIPLSFKSILRSLRC
jgi:hypothetical protein